MMLPVDSGDLHLLSFPLSNPYSVHPRSEDIRLTAVKPSTQIEFFVSFEGMEVPDGQ
jgi:hypothetical protein